MDYPYDIHTHKHIYAAWCAGRAYGRGMKGASNGAARALIEAVELDQVKEPEDITGDVDLWLLNFMRKMLAHAEAHGPKELTFGRAQKLVNIYLKTKLVCAGYHNNPKVMNLHPPLDRELFKGLHSHLKKHKNTDGYLAFEAAQKANNAWTTFTENDYTAHIEAIRIILNGKPLWSIEEHWSPSG